MNVTDLLELILQGESSRVEFKRDEISPMDLASEMVALLNHDGGVILLGVSDDGTICGLNRDPRKAEEWVMEVARAHVRPAWNPRFESFEVDSDRMVGVISIPGFAPDKPYKAKRASHWITYVRVGSTNRVATREEELRLFQASGGLRFGLRPVTGTRLEDLDRRRLDEYFGSVIGDGRQDDLQDSDLEGV